MSFVDLGERDASVELGLRLLKISLTVDKLTDLEHESSEFRNANFLKQNLSLTTAQAITRVPGPTGKFTFRGGEKHTFSWLDKTPCTC